MQKAFKILMIVGGICNILLGGLVAFAGYEPGIFSQAIAFVGVGIWLITDNV